MTRHETREQLFCLVFQWEFHGADEFEVQKEAYFEGTNITKAKDKETLSNRFDDLVSHLAEIDQIIMEHAKGWTMDRMGKAELALLRLSIYEVKFDEEVPDAVAINEAVELSKRYGGDQTPKFVNGILGKIVNE